MIFNPKSSKENNTLLDEQVIIESVKSAEVNMPVNSGISRNIMVTNQTTQHGPRMKISAYGKPIKHNDRTTCISMYIAGADRNGNPIVEYEGELSNIKMSNKEYKLYEKFFVDNYKIVLLGQDRNKSEYCDDVLRFDAWLRARGINFTIAPDGTHTIYDEHGKVQEIRRMEDCRL